VKIFGGDVSQESVISGLAIFSDFISRRHGGSRVFANAEQELGVRQFAGKVCLTGGGKNIRPRTNLVDYCLDCS